MRGRGIDFGLKLPTFVFINVKAQILCVALGPKGMLFGRWKRHPLALAGDTAMPIGSQAARPVGGL